MQLAYFTMPLHPPQADASETLKEDLEQIVALDRLGFVEAWIGEHLTSVWESIPCCDLLLASALPLTKNIRLGTGVNSLPLYNPLMLSQRIAQLDQMARGRFQWGVGSGGFPADWDVFGIDARNLEQRTLTRDVLETVLGLWNDPKPGVYEHPRWRFVIPEPDDEIGVRLHMFPYQRPHPPIGVAGIGPRSDMISLAGERGYLPMSVNFVTEATLCQHWQTYADSAAGAGRAADRSLWRVSRDVYVGETPQQARREAMEGTLGRDWTDYFLPLLRKTGMIIAPKLTPDMPDDAITLEYLCENIWIVGDVDEVTEKLRRLYQNVGGFGVLMAIGHEWKPREQWMRSMTLLSEEVMPRLQDLE